jgi:hypothetical protein
MVEDRGFSFFIIKDYHLDGDPEKLVERWFQRTIFQTGANSAMTPYFVETPNLLLIMVLY